MTGEKSMFITLTMKEGGNVKFGGNQSGKIIGIGTQGELTNLTLKYYWSQGELTNLIPLKSTC